MRLDQALHLKKWEEDKHMPNINDFKAKLRGGGARANQFRVTMPFPGYASVGGETETMSFLTTSTSLPGMTVTEVAIPFRGR